MDGGAEDVRRLLELDRSGPRRDSGIMAAVLPFGARNPIYAVLHESSYADGVARSSADRVQSAELHGDSFPAHGRALVPVAAQGRARPAAVRRCRGEPRPSTESAAASTTRVAQDHQRPCAAIIYADDPYVLHNLETADLLPGIHRWLTDGVSAQRSAHRRQPRPLDRLITLVRG